MIYLVNLLKKNKNKEKLWKLLKLLNKMMKIKFDYILTINTHISIIYIYIYIYFLYIVYILY
jgi:hypothetical protein